MEVVVIHSCIHSCIRPSIHPCIHPSSSSLSSSLLSPFKEISEGKRDEATSDRSQQLVGGGHAVGAAECHDDDEDEGEEDNDASEAPQPLDGVDVQRSRAAAVVQVDRLLKELLGREGCILLVQEEKHA